MKSPDLNAQLMAENIASQLERRISFRRAMKLCIGRCMKLGAKGIKIMVSGRLNGAEIARSEQYHDGTIPLQTLRADIDYGFAEAATTYGRIGVKVWMYKGEVLNENRKPPQGRGQQIMLIPKRVKYRRVHRGRFDRQGIPRQYSDIRRFRPAGAGARMDHLQSDRGCSCCHDTLLQEIR